MRGEQVRKENGNRMRIGRAVTPFKKPSRHVPTNPASDRKISKSKRITTTREPTPSSKKKRKQVDPYDHLDSETAMAMRRDDAEISELEAKLGLSNSKEKKRLYKEYAKHEGFGDDFGDFLDDLDDMVNRLNSKTERDITDVDDDGRDVGSDNSPQPFSNSENQSDSEEGSASDHVDVNDHDMEGSDSDETIPMGAPAGSTGDRHDELGETLDDGELDDLSESQTKADAETDIDKDHHTYRPSEGEDIYGKIIDPTKTDMTLSKYVPPHLLGGPQLTTDVSEKAARDFNNEESLKTIRRALNNVLNRLSEDSLITVSQTIARLYASHATANVNECFWDNIRNACIARTYLMTGLTPLYAAAIVGVHVQKGDMAHLGAFILEMTVTELYKALPNQREKKMTDLNAQDDGLSEKNTANLILLICYLYNFDGVHCNLLYDIVRDLIKSLKEIDVELLLIILSHCGRSLRADDPSALKAIVLEVQGRVVECKDHGSNSSRIDYMLSAVMDLKNNKKRQQDTFISEKTVKLRKVIGHIKSSVVTSDGSFRLSDSFLRVTLKDILEAGGKGRWWHVGASWAGKQHSSAGGENDGMDPSTPATPIVKGLGDEDTDKENKLMRLAAKYRVNSETRRKSFCIIMGSADFEDAFEKLVRAGMLKNKAERDTVRILMECCGNEKSYNSFYAHLAKRLCEFQAQSKFTFQLAFWDVFKQLSTMKPRKAANLAKLLFALVVEHRVLKLSVLKGIDMSSPDELSETEMIFLTCFFATIMDHFDDATDISVFFESGLSHRQAASEGSNVVGTDESEALYAGMTLFFVQILKSSPKYVKGTKFWANLKAAIKSCDTDKFFT